MFAFYNSEPENDEERVTREFLDSIDIEKFCRRGMTLDLIMDDIEKAYQDLSNNDPKYHGCVLNYMGEDEFADYLRYRGYKIEEYEHVEVEKYYFFRGKKNENKHTKYDLAQMQSLPLESKISMTQRRIRNFYDYYDGNVYISFSGGKDSTVLLDIARKMYPDIPVVFCDTGLEYPEVREFVKTIDNVIWIKPEMNFKQVIETHGYPFPSKEIAQIVKQAKIGLNGGGPRGGMYQSSIDKLNGCHLDKNGKRSGYNCEKWKFLLDAPFNVSHECCNIMKKKPFKEYERQTGNKPILAVMASESAIRKNSWIRYGCNAFSSTRARSWPMAFWTDNDVLEYLVTYNVPYASCYGDIVREGDKYSTNRCHRTGCVFCMFGCQLEKNPNRFQKLKETHPKLYDYCMRAKDKGGLDLASVLDYVEVEWK